MNIPAIILTFGLLVTHAITPLQPWQGWLAASVVVVYATAIEILRRRERRARA